MKDALDRLDDTCYYVAKKKKSMQNPERAPESEPKTITLGIVVSWIAGAVFILAGVGFMTSSIIGGVLLLLAAAVVLPPVHSLVKERFHLNLSGGLRVVLAIVLFAIGATMSTGDVAEEVVDTPTNDVSTTSVETETASASGAPSGTSMSYQEVFTFSGTGVKQSEPFTIAGDRFKVKYDCQGGFCSASLYEVGSSFPEDLIMNTTESVKDETTLYGAGEYYIEANTMGNFTITVEDYRPGFPG